MCKDAILDGHFFNDLSKYHMKMHEIWVNFKKKKKKLIIFQNFQEKKTNDNIINKFLQSTSSILSEKKIILNISI